MIKTQFSAPIKKGTILHRSESGKSAYIKLAGYKTQIRLTTDQVDSLQEMIDKLQDNQAVMVHGSGIMTRSDFTDRETGENVVMYKIAHNDSHSAHGAEIVEAQTAEADLRVTGFSGRMMSVSQAKDISKNQDGSKIIKEISIVSNMPTGIESDDGKKQYTDSIWVNVSYPHDKVPQNITAGMLVENAKPLNQDYMNTYRSLDGVLRINPRGAFLQEVVFEKKAEHTEAKKGEKPSEKTALKQPKSLDSEKNGGLDK